ncbi:MAG: TlpA family protein disulfide reductase [Bacteroidetes bacterium]|nr:TlpA family protein disulfide reductase [Bacteroidota bacterium]
MKKLVLFAAILLALVGRVAAQDLTSVDFRLRDVDGNEFSFQKYLASVKEGGEKGAVLISFWAMWCEPCKQEMKALVSVYEKYKDKNLHYLAVNLDNPRSLAKVKAYVRAQKLPYDFLLDPNSEVFKKLNGQSMPYSLIVSQDGKLVAKRTGYIAGDENEIEADIKKLLE